ncbi:MAG: SUMF1/EgtB/PvdO family nonheme iron enzyme, partial [Acidobacteriota bacterium]|nr:SUMF1/EgtB/PvdO family nonheme iron enzyme [Acidobacteriota bacterium]
MSEDRRFDLMDVDGPAWVQLEGSFTMGSDKGRDDERPVHEVTLSPYRISVFPVTNGQYAEYVRETDCAPPETWVEEGMNPRRKNHPVNYVSWDDARGFCAWLS